MNEASVGFKGTVNCLTMILQEQDEFSFILKEIENKISDAGKFFKDAILDVKYRGKNLTRSQEREIFDLLCKKSGAKIKSIKKENDIESDAGIEGYKIETAKEHLKSTMKHFYFKGLEEGMSKFYRGTVRSGHKIDFNGNVVVIGDLNPGGEIKATGNVIVIGSLRGTVHAGADGNKDAIIIALSLKPTQLRIADVITRPPDDDGENAELCPEIAYVKDERMYIENFLHK